MGRVTKNDPHECSFINRQWEDLDACILEKICSRIPVQDLFLNVSSVCQSWEASCWNYLFWSRDVLDLSAKGAGHGMVALSDVVSHHLFKSNPEPGIFGWLDSPEKYNVMATSLLRKLRRILEGQNMQGWTDTIQTIILPYDLEISDKHLFFISKRTPCLRKLVLLCFSKLTVIGFTRSIQNWKHVKEIHIGPLNNDVFAHFMEEMGRNCLELEILHIHQDKFRLDESSARLIAKSLLGLKKIVFELGYIHPSGVATLINKCLQMEEIYFSKCHLKPDYEIPGLPVEYEMLYTYSHHEPIDFHLTWSVDGNGHVKWDAEYPSVSTERLQKTVEVIREIDETCRSCTIEALMDPEFRKSRKSVLQSIFESWIATSSVYPHRKI